MQDVEKRRTTLSIIVLAVALTGVVAGCGGGGDSSSSGPPGLVPDAGGPSAGFNVVLSPNMTAPAAPGALVSPVPPVPPATGAFKIINQTAAIRLGKALFWDVQVGSDGEIACASCHFKAGADDRKTNTVHPGPDALFDPAVAAGPGATLGNFVTFDAGLVDDVVGSSGVLSREFVGLPATLDSAVEQCNEVVDPVFGTTLRLVTGRNTPPAIGAVFYLDNFWDGRASSNFNGQTPIGLAEEGATVVAGNSSLASQAVGPPLSEVEMSCANRTWNHPTLGIGAKMVARTPLAKQLVDPTDSVLGPLSASPAKGLTCGTAGACTYANLIAAAFGPAPEADYIVNFSNIWGQAVQAYEATLVPNRTPYDRGTLTANQVAGLNLMRSSGCMVCHVEPEFSDATGRLITLRGGPNVQKDVGGDQGFHNIGASLTADDRGRAASPSGVYNVSNFNEGAFKTPGLRNLALTAPYMHNGSTATLLDVLGFYDGTGQQRGNLGFDPAAEVKIGGSGNNDAQEALVVDFLENGLLDCRVVQESAPFDHPELVIPNGPALPAVGRTGNGTVCP
jgi:cytochrome c peroxidase